MNLLLHAILNDFTKFLVYVYILYPCTVFSFGHETEINNFENEIKWTWDQQIFYIFSFAHQVAKSKEMSPIRRTLNGNQAKVSQA